VQNFLAVVQDTVKGSYFDVSRQTIISVEGGDYTPSVLLALRIAAALGSRRRRLFFIALEES
jgi:putative transcriptional regulator